MKIKNQLIIGFSIIILLTISMFSYNFYIGTKNIKSITLIEDQTNDASHAKEIEFLLSGHSNDQRGYLLSGDINFIVESNKKLSSIEEVTKKITINDLPAAHKKHYAEFKDLLTKYTQLTNGFNQSVTDGKINEAKNIHLTEIRETRKQLNTILGEFEDTLTKTNHAKIQEVIHNINASQTQSIFLLCALTILSIGTVIVLINRINRPLTKLIDVSKVIAAGDFSIEIDTSRKDELGLLSTSFDTMKENVRVVIGNIIDAASKVASSSQELSASAFENTIVAQKLTETAITLATKGNDQQNIIQSTVSSVNDTIISLKQMKVDSEMMDTLSDQAYQSTLTGSKMIQTVLNDTKTLENQLTDTVTITMNLESLSKEIEQIAILIKEFADQTRLLSFNASIEAARAGEYGKGFSVVANEIKLLSDHSRENALKVTDLVKRIQNETLVCTNGMQKSYDQVEQNLKSMKQTEESFMQIMSNAKASKEKVQNVSTNISSIFDRTGQLLTATKSLEEIAHQLTTFSHENSASSEEQLASLEQISAASQSLSAIAEELENETQRFKI